MAWTVLVPLWVNLLPAAPAQAAASFYQIHDATTIWKTQGTCVPNGGNLGFLDGPGKYGVTGNQTDYAAGTYVATRAVGPRAPGQFTAWIIDNVVQTDPNDVTKGYDANIKTVGTVNCNLNGAIHIDYSGTKLKDATGTAGAQGGGNAPTDCNAGPGFTWLICGLINLLDAAIDWILVNVIIPILNVAPLNTHDPIYPIWSAFRNVASIFFILVFFLTIFGTAIGFDNYTIKKILPRLVAGAILVPFSWYICTIIIDIGNVLGRGLLVLGATVLPPADINLTSLASKGILVFLALSAATVAWTTISVGLLISVLISVVAAFLTLIFRQILIALMVVLSPFAVVAWILPNTEKYGRMVFTNLVKVTLMYPLIILLFLAGQLFADTAGALGGGNQNLTTFFAIVGLFAPMFLIPWTFKWAGGAMSAGAGAVGQFTKRYDDRLGRNSDFAKARAELKQHNMMQRSYDAQQNGHGFRARFYRSQTGQPGTGFNSMFGLRGNKLQQQALREKTDSAYDTEGKIGGAAAAQATGQLLSHRDRLQSSRLAGANDSADKNAQRHAVLMADRQRAPSGRSVAEERFDAARTLGRRTQSAEIGKNRGVNFAEDVDPQHGSTIGREAEYKEQSNQAMEREKIRRAVSAVRRIDANTRATQGLVGPDAGRQAAQIRMRTMGRAEGVRHQADIGKIYGQAVRTVTEDQGPNREDVLTQVAAADLSERKVIQDAKAARAESVRIQNSAPGGRVTDAQARAAANIEAREHSAQGIAHQQAVITGEAAAGVGETDDELVEGMYRQTEGKVLDDINARREGLRAENADAEDRNPTGIALTPQQLRAASTQRRQEASRQTKFLDANASVGQRTAVINAAQANPDVYYGSATPADAARRVRQAGAYDEGKRLGAQYGGYQASVDAGITEAAQAGLGPAQAFGNAALQASARRAADAARIKGGRDKVQSYSNEENLIQGQRVQQVDLGQLAEQTQREGEVSAANDNAAVLGKLEESQEAENKLIASGVAPANARDELMRQAGRKSRTEARESTANAYEETAGYGRGRREAIDRELARAGYDPATVPAGSPLRVAAENDIVDRGSRLAGQNKAKDTSQAAAANVGTDNIRNQAIQDLVDQGLTPQEAQARLDSNAYESGRVRAEDKETDTLGDEEGDAGSDNSAIDIYLDEQNNTRTDAERAAIRADPVQRRAALQAIRRTNRQARSRTTGNARTGKATENRGIIESRSRAVKRLRDSNPGLSEDNAYRRLDRDAHAKIYKDAADKYNRDIGEEQGTYESVQEKLRQEMNPTGAPPITREEAMQNMATKTIEKARESEGQKVSGEYGELDSTVAGIQEERERVAAGLLGLDLNDPNPAVRAANRTLARNHLNTVAGRNQVANQMRRRSRQAGAENAARAKAGDTGKTESLVQAHNAPNRPTEDDRADAATREAIKATANEAAGIQAHRNDAIPVVDPATQFANAFRARSERESEKVIDEAMTDAGAGLKLTVTDPATGNILARDVPLKDLQYSPAEIQAVRAEIDAAFTRGDIPTAMAAIEHLATGSSTAQRQLVDWTNPDSVVRRWFGGSDKRSVSTDPSTDLTRPNLGDLHPALRPQMQTLWNRAIKNGRDPDLKLPPDVVMDKIGPDQIMSGSDRWKGRLVSYITNPDRDGKAPKHQQQMASGLVSLMTNPTKSGPLRNPDLDNLHRFILRRSDGSGGIPAGVLLDNAGNPIRHVNPSVIDPATGNPADVVDPVTGDAFVREYIERPGEMSATPDNDYESLRSTDPARADREFSQYKLVLDQNTDEDPDAPAPVPPATRRRTKAETVIERLKNGHTAEGTP
jgi:hypothetical protein